MTSTTHEAQMRAIRENHERELRAIRENYERKMQEIARSITPRRSRITRGAWGVQWYFAQTHQWVQVTTYHSNAEARDRATREHLRAPHRQWRVALAGKRT